MCPSRHCNTGMSTSCNGSVSGSMHWQKSLLWFLAATTVRITSTLQTTSASVEVYSGRPPPLMHSTTYALAELVGCSRMKSPDYLYRAHVPLFQTHRYYFDPAVSPVLIVMFPMIISFALSWQQISLPLWSCVTRTRIVWAE